MTRRLILLLCAFAGVLFSTPLVHAQAGDTAAIRQRMQERLPRIDALKRDGALGENNRGFLEPRGEPAAEVRALADAENRDRATVYAQIARQTTGATAEDVGKARAQRIAEASAPGVWLQDGAGKWYQKL